MGKPRWQEQIAEERIEILFDEAENAVPDHPERADRYVEIARTIAMKFNLSLPTELREKVCRSCYAYLSPDRKQVRVEGGERRVTCRECGETMRTPLDTDSEHGQE